VTDEPHAKAWDEAKVLNWFWDWAEDVDEVHPPRDVLHAAVDHLPEDPLLAGIDGDEIIALLEEVARDAVRVAMGLGGKSHDRDAARPQQQAPRGLLVRVREGGDHRIKE